MNRFFSKKEDGLPLLMGIVNVTPDSFSDGGAFYDPGAAIAHGKALIAQGVDILDIGGESTRPGAAPVPAQQEMDRVLPVIEGLRGCGKLISIDTRHAATMKAAIAAGAGMVNDVSALTYDPDSLETVSSLRGPVCLMHMRGTPQTMQQDPVYDDVVAEVKSFLAQRMDACVAAGISRDRIVVDPGIGFGKGLQHNLELLRGIERLKELGVPVLIGLSRKSFIGQICPGTLPTGRLPGSLAGAIYAAQCGAHILRVHDVAETVQALAVFSALAGTPQ